MTRAPELDVQALLAQEPFVRALAGALAANDADDVAQQTWLQALQQRGPVAEPRSWLRRIAKGVASNLGRGERRRAQRERAAAVRERVPSSAELMEREERRSALVRAVDRLPVELREVVLLRWFEGLPPRRIAVELGLPVSTVSNRLRKALQRLRQRLDQEHGGHRRAWLLPLLPMSPRGPSPALPLLLAGVSTMTTKTKVALAFAVLLLLAGGYAWWPATEPAASAGAAASEYRMTGAVATPGAQVDAESGASIRREAVPATGSAAATTGALLVRVIHGDDHRPANGETLVTRRRGEDSPVADRLHRTDADGTVRIDALAPGTMLVCLLQHPDRQRVEIRGGQLTEYEYVVPAGLTVRGIVVDAEERPVAGAEVDVWDFNGWQAATATSTDADGRFMLRHVGRMSFIGARSADLAASRLQMLRGTDGSSLDVKIQLLEAGGTLAGTVWGPDGKPVAGAVVRVGTREVEGGSVSSLGLPSIAVPVRTDAEGGFRSLGLEAGEQRVFVRAVGLAPWQGTCFIVVRATASLRVDLPAGATIAGIVRDSEGKPAAGVDVVAGKHAEFTDSGTETAADGTFSLTELAASDQQVRAWHTQLGKAKTVVACRAGATVNCELTLSRGIELRGRVLDEKGAPMVGAYVSAFVKENSGDGVSGETDAEGRFTLPNCPQGLLTAYAHVDRHETRLEQVDPGRGPVELRLPRLRPAPAAEPSARITGRVLGADGRPVAGITVSALSTGNQEHSEGARRSEAATGADGTFTLGPVRPGTWTVYLQPQNHPTLATPPHELAANATWDVGSLQLVEGGTALIQVTGVPAGADVAFLIREAKGGKAYQGAQWIGEHRLRTWVLAPGDYKVQFACEGCARMLLPFRVRAGEETTMEARLQPGIRQRFEFARADGSKVTRELSHSLRWGDELLFENHTLYWNGPPSYGPDGAMTAALWFAPGSYRLDVRERDATASAQFTIGEREAPPLRIVLR